MECSFDFFVQPRRRWFWKNHPTIFVASRDRESSLAMSLESLHKNPCVKVIWMLRHPLDVLTSVHGNEPEKFYVEPQRLIRSLELYKKFRDEPQVLTVRYEELVSNPQAVQKKIADAFGLEPVRSFDESYKYFSKFKEDVNALRSIRPIDPNSLNKWKSNPAYRDYLKKTLADFPAIVGMAHDYGYEIDPATL